MKNRIVPYGYKVQSGKYTIDKFEAKTVRQIYSEYIKGESLKSLADYLTLKKIEYLPAQYEWNKNRVQRILSDERYTGTKAFDQIIPINLFESAKAIMQKRNTQTDVDPQKLFTSSIIPILCGKCGSPAIRNYDSRRKNKLLYKCSNPECKSVYAISDADLWELVTGKLSNVHIPHEISKEQSLEIRRLDNEIERDLESLDFDIDELKKKIFQCAALKYQLIESGSFIKEKPHSQFSVKEIQNLASALYLIDRQHINIRLNNGRMAGKEEEYI